MLQTVCGLTSALETGTNIMDQLEPIYAPYLDGILIFPSDPISTVEIDIRKNPSPRRVTTTLPSTKPSMELLDVGMVAGGLL